MTIKIGVPSKGRLRKNVLNVFKTEQILQYSIQFEPRMWLFYKGKTEEIKKSIEKITKRVVRLEAENDPNIIAGLELKVGLFLFNSSINSKLDSMKNILKRGWLLWTFKHLRSQRS